ncbi:hypothetical protein, partial [Tepidimonas fonticaldi]|uniref:hypothetical protein n=1 Tax=Tepidimonas fonticaldi TaxID=1101373 RepID=UPI001E313B9B
MAGAAIGQEAPAGGLEEGTARGQANARALEVLRAGQALKDAEQPLGARGVEAHAGVAHPEHGLRGAVRAGP